jgi:hypothetical protein
MMYRMSEESDEDSAALLSLYRQVAGGVGLDLPEDGLETEDIFRRQTPLSGDLAADELFDETVAEVERLYENGEL